MTFMSKFIVLIGLFFLTFTPAYNQDLTLDEVLEKYFKASGLDVFQSSKTIIMIGTLTQQDIMPLKIIKLRPDKYRMDFSVQDSPAIQAFDGQTAWWTMPWTGNNKPQIMSEERAKDIRIRADFDGILFNWQAKGHFAELVGREPMDSLQVYKIKVTRKDGGIEYYFIDAMRFLLQKRFSYRKQRDKEAEVENYFRDYRNIEGVQMAFVTENRIDGQTVSIVEYESVELKKPVDEKIFEMPLK